MASPSRPARRLRNDSWPLPCALGCARRRPTTISNPSQVTDGGLNDWRDRVIISAKIDYPPAMVDDIRKRRDEVHEGSVELFKSRLAQQGKDFDHWLRIERTSAGPVLAEAYRRAMARLGKIMSGEDLQDYESHGLSRFMLVKRLLQEEGDASRSPQGADEGLL